MSSMLFKTVMIVLIAFFGYMHSFVGSTMHNRPIIIAPLVGLVLGDLKTGIMVGATLELVWMGAFPIGASNPPDMVSGTIIGAAFVISTGQEVAAAVALAVPIATLVLIIDNAFMTFFIPSLCAKADKYALNGDIKGVERMHITAVIVTKLGLSILVGLGFYLGVPVIEKVLSFIPEFVIDGLNVATGLLPAIGFAMLARMLISKRTVLYFFLGFLLAAYLKVPLLGIALFGVIIAILTVTRENNGGGMIDDNEF